MSVKAILDKKVQVLNNISFWPRIIVYILWIAIYMIHNKIFEKKNPFQYTLQNAIILFT